MLREREGGQGGADLLLGVGLDEERGAGGVLPPPDGADNSLGIELADALAFGLDELGDGNWSQDTPVPGGGLDGGLLTQDQAGALYNYLLVARGGAYGVHNPKYIGEILFDSATAFGLTPLYPRP